MAEFNTMHQWLLQFRAEALVRSKKLLDVHTSSSSKYVTKLMEILFTKEELQVGYIKAEKSTSKREDLDNERVEILNGMQNII